MKRPQRSTPAGQHRPVLLQGVMAALQPQPGEVMVDCTTGWAGHAVELLQRLGPDGMLIGFDFDAANLEQARPRLAAVGHPFHLHHGNFAGLQQVLGERGFRGIDGLVADLGMSSMQVDDPQRGFSYAREGPLDMRMDPTRGKTASQLLQTISEVDLRAALETLADEPAAFTISRAIVEARQAGPFTTTTQLARLIVEATQQKDWQLHPSAKTWNIHPAARTFQALRILVNRELNNLQELLRILPLCLNPGGRAALISFHSGEDRLVKSAFKAGLAQGIYAKISPDSVRATFAEKNDNPRSRSAKLRWAIKPR